MKCLFLVLSLSIAVPGIAAAQQVSSEVGAMPGQPGFTYHSQPEKGSYVAPDLESDPQDLRIGELSARIVQLEERLERIENLIRAAMNETQN